MPSRTKILFYTDCFHPAADYQRKSQVCFQLMTKVFSMKAIKSWLLITPYILCLYAFMGFFWRVYRPRANIFIFKIYVFRLPPFRPYEAAYYLQPIRLKWQNLAYNVQRTIFEFKASANVGLCLQWQERVLEILFKQLLQLCWLLLYVFQSQRNQNIIKNVIFRS